jgi:O-antigen/teichoic acid export membrane protein
MQTDNKRIAKNTLALYLRQLLTMAVTLYTSRVILQVLGVDDFGIYNVVGGVVAMFSFLTGTMASASQRFLAFDMAKGDKVRLQQTFSLITLYYLIAGLVVVLLSESIGVWFLNTHMNIPPDKMVAANWVLQFSIASFAVSVLRSPCMADIIAHEHMGFYAYTSILDSLLRLLIVYILQLIACDKLILYAFLTFLEAVLINICYVVYCWVRFPESHYRFYFHKGRLKEIFSYTTWNMIGYFANILLGQGINILLNMFFNPAINAARAVAYQVNGAVSSLYSNFYMAVRPQIVKRFASGNKDSMLDLVYKSSKMAFFLMLLLAMPIFLYSSEILNIWLGTPPEYASLFLKLVLVNALLDTLSMPLVASLQAANRIKELQLSTSILILLNVPVSYAFLSFGYPPETTLYVSIVILAISFIPTIYYVHKIQSMPVMTYVTKVIFRLLIVTASSVVLCGLVNSYYRANTLMGIVGMAIIMILITLVLVFALGIDSSERKAIVYFVNQRLVK